jgi:hypothetical protein
MHLLNGADGREDLPRRAVAALKAIPVQEGGLHRVELVGVGEAFNRDDVLALARCRKVRQDKTRWPSMMTVHAPHAP